MVDRPPLNDTFKDSAERERPKLTYTPARSKAPRPTAQQIESLAEQRVQARHRADLEALEANLQDKLDRLIDSHVPEKVRELREDRLSLEHLSRQKQADKHATHSRSHNERVAARLRSMKERNARRKTHDRICEGKENNLNGHNRKDKEALHSKEWLFELCLSALRMSPPEY